MSANFNIQGNHLEVTPALDQYARHKLNKIQHLSDKITSVHVILSVNNRDHKAEADVKIAGDQHSIFAHAITDDLYKSIDALETKLVSQVKKYVEQLHTHKGRTGQDQD